MIREIVGANPGLNVSQIARKLAQFKPSERTLTIGKEPRITVRKHLNAMLKDREVARFAGVYFLSGGYSTELNNWVKTVLRRNFIADCNIPFAPNVAGCYLVSDPDFSHNPLIGLFEPLVERFAKSCFWLEDILTYAIGGGLMSARVYSNENGMIDKKKLMQGWNRCFGNTRLIVLAYAISPPELLSYITSDRGQSWATDILGQKWEAIVQAAKRRRSKLRALAESEARRRAE